MPRGDRLGDLGNAYLLYLKFIQRELAHFGVSEEVSVVGTVDTEQLTLVCLPPMFSFVLFCFIMTDEHGHGHFLFYF